MSKDRRIAILASMGWGVRNVLMSRAMDAVQERSEVHVFSTFNHVPAFRERFAHLDGLRELPEWSVRNVTRMLYFWNTYTFYRISPSSTHQHKLSSSRKKSADSGNRPKPGLMGRAKRALNARLHNGIRSFSTALGSQQMYHLSRQSLRQSLRMQTHWRMFMSYFRRNRIDTVISSNPLNVIEYPALIAARDMGLRTIAIITSWDNLSSKRPLLIDFDQYLVWNQIMADEVKHYYKPPPERIREIGPLQFDFYFDERFIDTRERFCAKYGFDPKRKLVVYSTVTTALMPGEPKIVEKLLLARKQGRIDGDPNILIRMHPKRELKEFQSVIDDPRFAGLPVAWTAAGTPVRGKNDKWCPLDDELYLLTNTVRHGDVNLNIFSTMLLDFAILDKPAVIVSHDENDNGCWDFEKYHHLQPVLACKGNALAHTFEESLACLNRYLHDPAEHAEGRRKLVDLECGSLLGESWRHLAEAILAPVPTGSRASKGGYAI